MIIIAVFMFLKPVLPVLDYVFNYDYIIKELCENKEKPEMQCNGKCHLMKELADAAEDEKPISDKKASQLHIEVLFLEQVAFYNLSDSVNFHTNKNNVVYTNLYTHLNASSIFHPPLFIS